MLRAFALAFIIALASCAHTSAEPPLNYTAVPASETGKHTRGDYDGDGIIDTADFFESNEGALTLIVRRAAAANEPTEIWGGDIASFPYFEVRSTGPGRYRNLCHLYGPDCGGAPREVTLTHDGVVVVALEGPAEFLYYWDGQKFKNIIISE